MRRRNGFTLMEMVVVLTIIALLVAILLPVMAKARDRSKTAACAANLRTLALGSIAYAADWEGNLCPEYLRGVTNYTAYSCYQARDTGATGQPWSFALLNTQNIVVDTRAFYCPAQPVAGWSISTNSFNSWMDMNGNYRSGAIPVRIGYMYQVHSTGNPWAGTMTPPVLPPGANLTPFPPWSRNPTGTSYVSAAYPRLADFPAHLALATDITYDYSTIPHYYGTGVNLCYADGHVGTAVDQYFKTIPSGYLNNSFVRLDRILSHEENESH